MDRHTALRMWLGILMLVGFLFALGVPHAVAPAPDSYTVEAINSESLSEATSEDETIYEPPEFSEDIRVSVRSAITNGDTVTAEYRGTSAILNAANSPWPERYVYVYDSGLVYTVQYQFNWSSVALTYLLNHGFFICVFLMMVTGFAAIAPDWYRSLRGKPMKKHNS